MQTFRCSGLWIRKKYHSQDSFQYGSFWQFEIHSIRNIEPVQRCKEIFWIMPTQTAPWLSHLSQVQIKLYLMPYVEKKVSFMPLENSLVEIVNEKKNMFTVRDKFNNIIFKTSSKEDMFSWYSSIYQGFMPLPKPSKFAIRKSTWMKWTKSYINQ